MKSRERDLDLLPVAYACDAHLKDAGFEAHQGTCCKAARPLYRKKAAKLKTRPDADKETR